VLPALGQGTWTLAEVPEQRASEIGALRLGIDLGMTVIDTAEAYGDGRSESLVGEAVAGLRDQVFIVSKVLPKNATYQAVLAACEGSLRRLNTDRLDLYLLHWPRDDAPLDDGTFAAFEDLVAAGKIRQWGVSNFALADLRELASRPWGRNVASNQILYNLRRRAAERDVVPWCRERGIPIMAYSPIEGGRMSADPVLRKIAAQRNVTAVQVALAWLLRQPGVLVIPKAGSPEHVLDNRDAAALELTDADLAELDAAFPAQSVPVPFEMG
jgi:diketogulonate reductase-like aldo/keto reductase